jgi:hypothetical protein
MRTPLRRSIAQVLKIARAGGRPLRQRIWSDACRFPRGSAQDLAQSWPRSSGAGDAFLTVPYRPILARLDCQVQRRLDIEEVRLSRPEIAGLPSRSCRQRRSVFPWRVRLCRRTGADARRLAGIEKEGTLWIWI